MKEKNIAGFAEYEMQAGRWRLNAVLRYEHVAAAHPHPLLAPARRNLPEQVTTSGIITKKQISKSRQQRPFAPPLS